MSESPRRVHFVAIGGTGMGSLAGLLQARGLEVSGSDAVLYPPMSTQLERWGVPVHRGFRPEHVLDDPPDLVVIGNAVRPDNPEARAAIDEGLPYLSFPDALHRLAIAGRHSVVVTGTHGKTTTTALLGSLLQGAGRDPSVLVGGYVEDFGGSFRSGGGEHFVVEGDEYDTAFFDKTPKFLHYGARTAVITSLEFDHADIYRDLDHVKEMFRRLVAQMPAEGTLVAAWGHPDVREVVSDARCRVVGYGLDVPDAAWSAEGVEVDGAGSRFRLRAPGVEGLEVRVPMHGRFNVENALAALATAAELGVDPDRAVPLLAAFGGVKRRQEVRGEVRGVTVLDDFAHHPTAVAGTVEAVAARFPGRRVVAVFEARSNTSRRAIFQERYADALAGADVVVVAEGPRGPIYSATGEVTEFFDAARLVTDLRRRGLEAAAPGDVDAIVSHLQGTCGAGDVVLVMSNGDFGGLWEKLLAALGRDQT